MNNSNPVAIRNTLELLLDAAPDEARAAIVAVLGGTVWGDSAPDGLIESSMRECLKSYARCACGRAIWRCSICCNRQSMIGHPECRECAACLAHGEGEAR